MCAVQTDVFSAVWLGLLPRLEWCMCVDFVNLSSIMTSHSSGLSLTQGTRVSSLHLFVCLLTNYYVK